MGLEPGWTSVEKFGENSDVNGTQEDVWSEGGVYTYSTIADIDTISSSSPMDTEDILIIGQTLDNTEVTQTVTLNGQNKVVLPTPLLRIYRAYNDGSNDLIGDVYTYVDTPIVGGIPTLKSEIRAKIATTAHNIPPNQTEMALYTIPKGFRGFFIGGYVSMNNLQAGNFAIFVWKLRLKNKVFRVQSRIACIGAGSSHWNYQYGVPVAQDGIPEGTDIAISVDEVGTANTACAGGFTILLQRQA